MGTQAPLPTGRAFGLSGIAAAFGTLIWSQIDTAKTQADMALAVAAQHGQELNELRSVHQDIWSDIARLQAQNALGGRFTAEDGERLEVYIDRLRTRLERLESRNAPITSME